MSDSIDNRNQYALAALKKHRALHAGQLAQLEGQVRLEREALAHLDAVLRIFAPEVAPETVPARRARKSTLHSIDIRSRRIMSVLRRRIDTGSARLNRCRRGGKCPEAISRIPYEPSPCAAVIDAIAAEMGFSDDAASVIADQVRDALRNMANGTGPVMKSGSRRDTLWGLQEATWPFHHPAYTFSLDFSIAALHPIYRHATYCYPDEKGRPHLAVERPKSREETPTKGMYRERYGNKAIPHFKKIKPHVGLFLRGIRSAQGSGRDRRCRQRAPHPCPRLSPLS